MFIVGLSYQLLLSVTIVVTQLLSWLLVPDLRGCSSPLHPPTGLTPVKIENVYMAMLF